MTTAQAQRIDRDRAATLAEGLAEVFRTGQVGDALTEDVFLDGHPPFWRFQLSGRETFAGWLAGYVQEGAEVRVAHSRPADDGFACELVGRYEEDGEVMTDRKIALCRVRDGRISELVVYCSGDWNAELRARHASETTLIRE